MPIADISVGGVAEVVAQQINHRTWGRIHRLKLEQTHVALEFFVAATERGVTHARSLVVAGSRTLRPAAGHR
jgi:hypothetical protein